MPGKPHSGATPHSGRYAWGSGENPEQRARSFTKMVKDLEKDGFKDVEIAKMLGLDSTTELVKRRSISNNEILKQDRALVMKLREDDQNSNVAIGKMMGRNESSVRALQSDAVAERLRLHELTANVIRDKLLEVNKDDIGFVDIGHGTENALGISDTKLAVAVAMLKDEGYKTHKYQDAQQTNIGQLTTHHVISLPEHTLSDVRKNDTKIHFIGTYNTDKGKGYAKIETPINIDSSRIAIKYAEEGGAEADGVVQLRRGVEDLSLGGGKYKQVRIAVDGTHYIKGMAVYGDDIPKGYDMVFNTNKKRADKPNKLDVLKPIKDDPDLPFGSVVRQATYLDSKGNEKLSPINIVNDDEDWNKWSKNLSAQMLSKQTKQLAQGQLDLTFATRKAEFEEIMSLNNPTVRKTLLKAFSEGTDSSAVHLKAAAMPGQKTHVLLPINSIKDSEVYAPNYPNGTKVVLIRYPHGGKFEIPELTVNNRNKDARRIIGTDADVAIGINHRVAQRMSGADFDGDTVLVVPNDHRRISTASPLQGLKDFEPQIRYPEYEGMIAVGEKGGGNTQQLMGDISNLITDMTIMGANNAELARAVRHSMVVIDAENKRLDVKQSKKDHNINQLKTKYQGSATGGASTLISLKKSEERVLARRDRGAKDGGKYDPVTGERRYTETGKTYVDRNTGEVKYSKLKSTKLYETTDAHTLSSGTAMEKVYADHSNKLKALANKARKEYLKTPNLVYSPAAKEKYAPQVKSLKASLSLANSNAPLERQAQRFAKAEVKSKLQANPNLEKKEVSKIRGAAIKKARQRIGAAKNKVNISEIEWEAIQAGAISNNFLENILKHADLDQVKAFATPRATVTITGARLAKLKSLLANGYTQAEAAENLGVSVTTITNTLAL